jgi:hypothetical protein
MVWNSGTSLINEPPAGMFSMPDHAVLPRAFDEFIFYKTLIDIDL